jgi:hypothetical protein
MVLVLWAYHSNGEEQMQNINTPCPSCGREEDGKWFKPCPSDDCPSHWEDKGKVHPQHPLESTQENK